MSLEDVGLLMIMVNIWRGCGGDVGLRMFGYMKEINLRQEDMVSKIMGVDVVRALNMITVGGEKVLVIGMIV